MRTTTGTSVPVDTCAVLATAAAGLADDGPSGVRTVLDGVVRSLGLRSAVLRDVGSDGGLRAVAGDVVHAVPHRREAAGPESVIELPVHACGRRVATLTVVGARPSHLPVLRALCAVIGLALTERSATTPDPLPLALIEAADADADATADDLHDGPVQDLVFARFAADAALRNGDAVSTRDAVQAALQAMRRSLWLLRPRGAGEGGLPAALSQLSDRLLDADRPALEVDLDPQACTGLGPHAASVGYRLVQALAARTGQAPTAVRVHRADDVVHLQVDADEPLPAPERWAVKARAVGAVLTTEPTGRVLLSVPAARASTPAP